MEKPDVLLREVGGEHYKSSYQPIELMEHVRMCAACSFILKYVYRHKNKGGKDDLQKALHCCELLEQLGNNWYIGTARNYDEIDMSVRDFHRFIQSNEQLDDNQTRAILAICDKDMESLKKAIHAELSNCYS